MSFVLAEPHGVAAPKIRQLPLAAASSFAQGALLVVNGDGAYAQCAADPASVAAVAATPAGTDATGFNMLGTKEFPPGYMQGILVGDDVPFRAKYTGTLPAANGGSYGVVVSGGQWVVDFSDTTNLVVKLIGRFTDSPENIAQVKVTFLAAVVQPF